MTPRQSTVQKPVVGAVNNSLDLTADETKPLAADFLKDHPKGLTPAEIAEAAYEPEVIDAPQDIVPPLDAPATEDAPAEPAAEKPIVEGEKPAVEAPAAQAKPGEPAAPAAEVKPAVEAAAPAEPAKPVYDPAEKFALADGVEWTREQVVAGLQERAELLPKAEAAKGYADLFKMDLETAKKEWAPVLETLAKDPAKAQFMTAILNVDAAKLEYLIDSANFWDGKVAEGAIKPAAAPAAAAQPAQPAALDPRVQEALNYVEQQKQRAGTERAEREWGTVLTKYPFLRSDNKVTEALLAQANALYEADRKAGKSDMEARGLIAAVEANAALLDARLTVMRHEQAPPVEPTPAAKPVAILGATGAAPTVPSTRPGTGHYRGDPQNAVAAFLKNEK